MIVGIREGTGGLGEYLTEYAMEHGDIPGRKVVLRNVLVPRAKSRYGEFMGCSNYPNCRFTRDL